MSGKLNPALSNRSWVVTDGAGGKRDYLLEHSSLKLNAAVVAAHPSSWTEDDIRDRTARLTERLLDLWPRPIPVAPTVVGHEVVDEEPVVVPDDEDDAAAGPSHTGKYRTLWRWLREQTTERVELTFDQVEQIIGGPLPPSCRLHLAHWYGVDGSAVARAIRDAGWKATAVDLQRETVAFLPQQPTAS